MIWTRLLEGELAHTYKVTEKLLDLVDGGKLDWKPAPDNNWMTTGQLLKHISNGCGSGIKGAVTGDWGFPEDFDPSSMTMEDMLPPAEKMPAVESLAEAKELLAEDKKTAVEMLAKCSPEDLATKPSPVPWDPTEIVLGQRLLQMVDHLRSHKAHFSIT